MCKILTVVVAFLWAFANSIFLGRDSLPLVSILKVVASIVLPNLAKYYLSQIWKKSVNSKFQYTYIVTV